MTIPPNGDGYTRDEEVGMLRAKLETATKALERIVNERSEGGMILSGPTMREIAGAALRSLADGAKP